MKTGSLRARVILTTLALLAIVLAGVVTAVTLAYRAKLDGDLHSRLAKAGAAVERAGSAGRQSDSCRASRSRGSPSDHASRARRDRRPAKTRRRSRHADRCSFSTRLSPTGRGLLHRQPRKHRPRRHQPPSRRAPRRGRRARARHAPRPPRHPHCAPPPLRGHRDRDTDRPRRLQAPPQAQPHRYRTRQPRRSIRPDGRRPRDSHRGSTRQRRRNPPLPRRRLPRAPHPIAALQASVETLLREQPERPERDRLEAAVARESERLGRLVDDLLGLARLEAHPTRTPVDLAAIARPLVEEAHVRAPHAAITLSADDDATVNGDPDALERVLRNLIDNALAAIQPTGRIDVQLRRRNGYVQAHVTDDGPGVPEHERERNFERFVPTRPQQTRPRPRPRHRPPHRPPTPRRPHLRPPPNGASFTLRLPAES